MNKAQARARVKAHLDKYAPEIADAYVLWSDVALPEGNQAEAHIGSPQDFPLTQDLGGAAIFICAKTWQNLSGTERRDLIDHEVAHLIQFARVWRLWNAPDHGEAWASIYEELRSTK